MINIKKRLHHREPYLLIDKVLSANKLTIVAVKTPKLSEFYLEGHFPGAPVVPGSMMQEMTTQAAGLLIAEFYSPVQNYDSDSTPGYALGVLRAIHRAKYKKFVRPDEVMTIKVTLIDQLDVSFRFVASIKVNQDVMMTNEFTLINISEEKLKA